MTNVDTESKLWRDIIDTVQDISCLDSEQQNPNTTLEELGFEPLDSAELVVNLEEKFDIIIPDVDWEEIKSIGDIYNYITSKKGTK